MEYLDPTSAPSGASAPTPTLATLKGARLAYLSNGWASMNRIGQFIEGPLKSIYGVSEIRFYEVPRNAEPAEGLLDRLPSECDAAILGIAN